MSIDVPILNDTSNGPKNAVAPLADARRIAPPPLPGRMSEWVVLQLKM